MKYPNCALELVYDDYQFGGTHEVLSYKIWQNKIRKDLISDGSSSDIRSALYTRYFTVYDCTTKRRYYFDKQTEKCKILKENSVMGRWTASPEFLTEEKIPGGESLFEVIPAKTTHLGRSAQKVVRDSSLEYVFIEFADLDQFLAPVYWEQFERASVRIVFKDLEVSGYPLVGLTALRGVSVLVLQELKSIDFISPSVIEGLDYAVQPGIE